VPLAVHSALETERTLECLSDVARREHAEICQPVLLRFEDASPGRPSVRRRPRDPHSLQIAGGERPRFFHGAGPRAKPARQLGKAAHYIDVHSESDWRSERPEIPAQVNCIVVA
jgi:hypothetical protein